MTMHAERSTLRLLTTCYNKKRAINQTYHFKMTYAAHCQDIASMLTCYQLEKFHVYHIINSDVLPIYIVYSTLHSCMERNLCAQINLTGCHVTCYSDVNYWGISIRLHNLHCIHSGQSSLRWKGWL